MNTPLARRGYFLQPRRTSQSANLSADYGEVEVPDKATGEFSKTCSFGVSKPRPEQL